MVHRASDCDLSQYYVSPGLVDAHNHLALTYKRDPENNSYYLTSVMDSTAIRAIQAVSNGITMMSSGFTMVRDLGNAVVRALLLTGRRLHSLDLGQGAFAAERMDDVDDLGFAERGAPG